MSPAMRRLVGVLAGVVLVAGVALLPVLPAGGAGESLLINGSAVCDPVTGQYDVMWSATNVSGDTRTIESAIQDADGPTDIVALFSPNPVPDTGTAVAYTTVPGTATGLQLTVTDDLQVIGPVGIMITSCTATAALQVAPTAAVPGETVTISGTGCVLDELIQTGVAAAATAPGIVTGNVAFTPPLPFGPINAEADGTWSATIVVPPGTPAGTYAVNATCTLPIIPFEVSAQAQETFQYAPGSLTIAVPAAPKFTG